MPFVRVEEEKKTAVVDIAEREAFDAAITMVKEQWGIVFKSVRDSIFLIDQDKTVLQANPATAELLGIPGEEIAGKKCYELVHGLESPPDTCITCRALETGESCSSEQYEPFLGKCISISADPVFGLDGSVESVVHTIRDISEQEKARGALAKSESIFRALVQSTPDPIFLIDSEGNVVSASDRTVDLLEVPSEEVMGVSGFNWVAEEDRERVGLRLAEALEKGSVRDVDFTIVGMKGKRTLVEASASVIAGTSGIPEGIAVVFHDITKRKQTEEALSKSEEHYRLLFESSRDALMTLAPPSWRFTSCNPAALEMFGANDASEFTSVGPWDLSPEFQPDGEPSADKAREMIETAVRDGSSRFEWAHRRFGGGEFPAVVLLTRMEIDGQMVVQASVRDITKRKAAENALRKSEEQFRQFADNLPEVVFEADGLGRFVYVNSNALQAFGYTEEELYSGSVNVLEMITEGYRERAAAKMQRILTEGSQGSDEYMARRKDGSTFPAIISTIPIIEDETTVGLRGVLTDITGQKQAEEALRVSEEHFRLLVENASEVVLTTDLDLSVTYASPSVERETGFTAEEVVGRDTREFITEESFGRIAGVLADQLARQSETDATPPVPVMIEIEQRRKDGSTYPAEISAGFLRDPEGTPYGAIVASRNITERKQAEEALRKAEERFRQFADNLPQVIFEVDSMGRFVYVNSSALHDFGYTDEELSAGSISVLDVISEEYHEQAIKEVQEVLSEGPHGSSSEYMARRKDGSVFPVVISALPVVEGGIVAGMRGVLTDITGQKEIEDQLERVNEELKNYSHTVSHDLKAPLTAVSLAAEVLSNVLEGEGGAGLGGDVGETLRIIRESTWRANTLIGNLLALAEVGQGQVRSEPVDISEVVRIILEEKKELLKGHCVQVSPNGDLGVAAADPTHAYQLFANLVGNAIKHGGSENPEIQISCLGENEQGRLGYLIRDNGQGVPEQLLETLFAPFVKGQGGGSGVGLAIADKVVRLYGGEIRAYNDDGACFEFSLPKNP